jgi:nucleotide-binding universal stress UspA family protein
MPRIHHVLVPVDFSPHARRALEYGCELARRFEGRITILHAYTLPNYQLMEGSLSASPQAIAELITGIETALEKEQQAARQLGVANVATLAREGRAVDEIIRAATELDADVIAMGTHGRSGLSHALLGSVTDKVIRNGPCPVLTVRVTAK